MRKVRWKRLYRHWTALALAGVCLLASGCSEGQEEEDSIVMIDREEESVTGGYVTAVAALDDVVKTAKIRCVSVQTSTEEIGTSASGKKVEEVYVRPGDTVVKGQLLAVLTGGDRMEEVGELEYRIARNRLLLGYTDTDEAYDISYRWWNYVYQSSMSEADEERLEEDLEAIRQSYRYKREDYQDAIDLDSLKAELLRQELEQGRLYAGMDGVITYMYYTNLPAGTSVEAYEVLIRIADNSSCIFEASASSYADSFQEGQVLQLEMDSGSSQAVVDVIPYDMEHWDDKLYFEAVDGEGMEIQPGEGGSLNIVADSREQVLTIPKKALYTAGVEKFVYVQGEDNFREVRWVETGLEGDSLVEIVSGLSEGEEVIMR